jgi:hypothetical protein
MSSERPLARVFQRAADWLDDAIPPAELRSYLLASILALEATRETRPDCLPIGAVEELVLAHHLAHLAGLPIPPLETPPPDGLPSPDDEAVNAWISRLAQRRVVSADGLVPGTGACLMALLRRARTGEVEFLGASLESLLRHVEIRRKTGLRLASPASAETAWMEKHAVAILFSRVARERGDLRFLNAALKLNDWAYPAHRSPKPSPRHARYLLSLAEQERVVRERLG